MAERLANLGYLGLIKESTKGTPLTPTDYIPLYDETLDTNGNFVKQSPVYGNKASTYNVMQGQRSHKGDLTVLAEPNTSARLFDMLLTKLSTTGSNPYTHTFGLSNTTNPNSYTIDVSTGNVVARYWGVEASKLSPIWNKNELQWKVSVSALGSFQTREIASISGTGPTTVTLKTDYDPSPTTGLVATDLVRFKTAAGTTFDTSVTSITNGTTFVVPLNLTGITAGDSVTLRPATPSYNLLSSFQWAKNQWQFGLTAAGALSASQTRVEQGSMFELMHNFESDDGALRSGAYDPAALVRTTGDASVSITKFFDTPDDLLAFNNLQKNALQIRHLAGSTNQYEARITMNHLKYDGNIMPNLKSGEILYEKLTPEPQYDSTDGQMFGVTIINTLATV